MAQEAPIGLRWPLVIPDDETLARFHNLTRSLVESNGETIIENKKLVGLRDRLLPMLMNGQATVEAMQPNYRLSYRSTWTCAWAPAEVRKNIGHGTGGSAVTRISAPPIPTSASAKPAMADSTAAESKRWRSWIWLSNHPIVYSLLTSAVYAPCRSLRYRYPSTLSIARLVNWRPSPNDRIYRSCRSSQL